MEASLRIFWVAMLAAVAVYAAIPVFWKPPPSPLVEMRLLLLGILAAIAAMTAVASFVVRSVLIGRGGAERVATAYVVAWVLSESVGVLGLVALGTLGERGMAWAFAAGALLLLVLHAPRSIEPTLGPLARGGGRMGRPT